MLFRQMLLLLDLLQDTEMTYIQSCRGKPGDFDDYWNDYTSHRDLKG